MADASALRQEDFTEHALALLPQGRAWPREPDTVIYRFFAALGDEAFALHDRSCALLAEYPPKALELLVDWERTLGLPDPCLLSPPETIGARRAAVTARLANQGGQSIAYLVSVAATAGFEITIREYEPFAAGESAAGDALTNDLWAHAFEVTPAERFNCTFFAAGESAAGDPLMVCEDEGLICILDRVRPAHSVIVLNEPEE
ncbi:MAG: putative phage tail protein [Pseudomonadota bacterium]